MVPLDLNTASNATILMIPGIGKKIAPEFGIAPIQALAQFGREMGKYVKDKQVARLDRDVFMAAAIWRLQPGRPGASRALLTLDPRPGRAQDDRHARAEHVEQQGCRAVALAVLGIGPAQPPSRCWPGAPRVARRPGRDDRVPSSAADSACGDISPAISSSSFGDDAVETRQRHCGGTR
ncbi:MAG: hypothetical protein U5M23_08740 [Marinagarivorans sp.]|nr:hypothetical protein [Marinagarivorans sp.]